MNCQWGAKKIFSLDVERVLLENTLIENCVVVPVDHAKLFQAPVAFVILKKGVEPNAVTERELRAYSEINFEEVFRLLQYIFTEKFPLTKVGKVDNLALEKIAAENNK